MTFTVDKTSTYDIHCCLGVYMSWSQFGHVCRHGVIFLKLGIGPLILASKPVTGFKNSIQVCNQVYLSVSSAVHYITSNVQMM